MTWRQKVSVSYLASRRVKCPSISEVGANNGTSLHTRPLQCLQGQNSFWPCDGRLNEELASKTLRAKPEVGREEESEESEGEDESNEVEEDEDDESEDCDEESEESPSLEDSEEEFEEEEESDDLLLFLPLAIPETSRKNNH